MVLFSFLMTILRGLFFRNSRNILAKAKLRSQKWLLHPATTSRKPNALSGNNSILSSSTASNDSMVRGRRCVVFCKLVNGTQNWTCRHGGSWILLVFFFVSHECHCDTIKISGLTLWQQSVCDINYVWKSRWNTLLIFTPVSVLWSNFPR